MTDIYVRALLNDVRSWYNNLDDPDRKRNSIHTAHKFYYHNLKLMKNNREHKTPIK